MVNRRSFKSDVSFLEKISMGATGTIAVFNNLEEQGHTPIELERGSRSFKIAFVVCNRTGDKPVDWQANELIQYVSVKDLRLAQSDSRAISTKPKGAEEGFEIRIIWHATIANASGTITSVSQDRIQYRRQTDKRLITLRLSKKGQVMMPFVKNADNIAVNQILASVVPVTFGLDCDKSASESHYIKLLSSTSLNKRYLAAKALAFFDSQEAFDSLVNKLNDSSEHIYVRLETAASLAHRDDKRGYDFIEACLSDEYLQNRLEAVIVLGEIVKDASSQLLIDTVLDNEQHPEIRAGAAWALGELQDKGALNALIECFTAVEESIRIEAARALAKLAQRFTPEIIREFPIAPPAKRSGISWALSKAGKFTHQDMLSLLVDDDARQWVAYIIGTQDQQRYIYEIEELKTRDPEVYFAVTVLWKIMTSWIYKLGEY